MADRSSSGCGIVGMLAIIALLIVAMFAGGWIYLRQSDTETQIIIDKEKVRSDTDAAVESGRKMINRAGQGIEEATDNDGAVDDETLPDSPES